MNIKIILDEYNYDLKATKQLILVPGDSLSSTKVTLTIADMSGESEYISSITVDIIQLMKALHKIEG